MRIAESTQQCWASITLLDKPNHICEKFSDDQIFRTQFAIFQPCTVRFVSLKQAQDHLGSKETKIKYSRLAATWLKVVEVECYSTGYAKAMSTIIEHLMSFEIKMSYKQKTGIMV